MNRTVKLFVPIAYMALIFAASSIPMTGVKAGDGLTARQILQNCLHIPVYALLAVLWARAFISAGWDVRKAVFVSLVIVAAYAVFDEWHQSFVPGRCATVGDAVLDVVGGMAGLAAWRVWNVSVGDTHT